MKGGKFNVNSHSIVINKKNNNFFVCLFFIICCQLTSFFNTTYYNNNYITVITAIIAFSKHFPLKMQGKMQLSINNFFFILLLLPL